MHRAPTYLLAIPVTVMALLAHGIFQPHDGELQVVYTETTVGTTETIYANAFFSYTDGTADLKVAEIDCTTHTAVVAAGTRGPNPVSCARGQYFTTFGLTLALAAWIPIFHGGSEMYKLAYSMLLAAALALWFGYESVATATEHVRLADAADTTKTENDHTFPIVLIVTVVLSMTGAIAVVAKAADNLLDKTVGKLAEKGFDADSTNADYGPVAKGAF